MNKSENISKLQPLMDDFVKTLRAFVKADSTLSINQELSTKQGEVMQGSHVFVYTSFPGTNTLNIQFGEERMVRGTPAQAIFYADFSDNCWLERHDKSKKLTNDALIKFCIERLNHLASCKF